MKRIASLFLLLFWATFVFGQRPTSTFGAADSHAVDSINLSTLVPTLNIPVFTKSAGVLPGSIILESPQNCFIGSTNGQNQSPWRCGNSNTDPGVSFYHVESSLIGLTLTFTSSVNGSCTTYFINGLSGVDNLTFYPLFLTLHYPSACGSISGTATTSDNSGITATVSTAGGNGPFISTWTDASGNTGGLSTPNWSVTDPFSNNIQDTGSKFTDTLGAVTNLTGLTGGLPTDYAYTDTNGSTQHVTLNTGTAQTYVPLGSACGTFGTGGTSVTPVTSISYPDTTSIGLGWQTNGSGLSGLINSITLRTGGTISYTYGTLLDSGCLDSTHQISIWAFNSLKRTTPDGETDYSTTNTAGVGTAGTITTTVLDPGKNKTVYTFVTASITNQPFLASVYKYQNTNTVASPTYALVSNSAYCYNGGACPATVAPTGAVTQYDVYNYVGPSSLQMNHEELTYDSYGDILTDATTDNITTGNPTVTKTIVYGSYSSGTCSALGNTAIHNKPCTVTTKNGTTWLSESTFTYNSNGAPTASAQCLNSTCSSTLATSYTPNTIGTIASVTMPSSQSVSYTYGSCNSLLPTASSTTINSIVLSTSTTWDCNGGVVTSTTDVNSNEDDMTYDSLFRLSSYTDRLENQGTFNYTSTSLKITDPLGVVNYVYFDSSGRPSISQTKQSSSSSNYDTVSKTFQQNGTNFQITTSVPCVTTLDNTCSTTAITDLTNPVIGLVSKTDINSGTITYGYGANDTTITLGPAPSGEHTKANILEMDGFGRISSVCNVLAGMGSTCHQQSNNNGVFTTFSYSFGTGSYTASSIRGSQTHTNITDALGRVTSVTTPETGTITYLYDTDSSGVCAGAKPPSGVTSEPGMLMLKTFNSNRQVCYIYDSLNRLTDSQNSQSNECRRFRYDATANGFQSAPSGYPSSGANILGRIVEAETDTCGTSPTLITDEWFVYNKIGQMTDMWIKSPNSGGNYRHTTVAYNADGTLTSLAGIPGVSTITYGVDGEDRWNSATLGTTTIIPSTGVTYDSASAPTQINIGTGTDKDTFSYDSLHNMTQYQFFVGSANNKGIPSWNSNGSLASLTITDGLNTNNSQTCTFGYDDLSRITGDNCGTVWAQTYSYDQYDNLSKSGSRSWSPGYSSTNNQFQNGATYDSDGNLTNDGASNTYTFNHYNKAISINGTAITYDAFGRMVAFGSSNEYLYSPLGKVATLQSGTVVNATVPLPGGRGLLNIDSLGNTHYYHSDWIGSSRTSHNIGNSGVDFSKSYSPYGDPYNSNGNDIKFAGISSDTSLGVTYDALNRELATNASRWISPDPAHASWNAYAYVTDPNTQTDPSGLCEDPLACGSNDPLIGGQTGQSGQAPDNPIPQPCVPSMNSSCDVGQIVQIDPTNVQITLEVGQTGPYSNGTMEGGEDNTLKDAGGRGVSGITWNFMANGSLGAASTAAVISGPFQPYGSFNNMVKKAIQITEKIRLEQDYATAAAARAEAEANVLRLPQEIFPPVQPFIHSEHIVQTVDQQISLWNKFRWSISDLVYGEESSGIIGGVRVGSNVVSGVARVPGTAALLITLTQETGLEPLVKGPDGKMIKNPNTPPPTILDGIIQWLVNGFPRGL